MVEDKYCRTLPELAREASTSPYGGTTHRPRILTGYLELPDGKRYWLGKIGVKIDGYGDGLITDCDLVIKASMIKKEDSE